MKLVGPLLVLLMSVTLSITLGACSDDGEKNGASCKDNSDCASENKVCHADKCVDPSNNLNPDGGLQDGGEEPIEAEEYAVSYYLERSIETPKVYELRLLKGDKDIKLHPDDVSCGPPAICLVSKDLKHFVYTTESEDVPGGKDVYVAPLGADFKFASDAELVVSGTRGLRQVDNLLTYSREVSGVNRAYYMELGKSGEHQIGEVGGQGGGSSEAGWVIDGVTKQAAVFVHSLQTMDVFIGKLGQPLTNKVFTVNAENYQEVSGSYFGGNVPAAFSADGKYLSFLTVAPNNYGTCNNPGSESSPDCKGPGQRCGRFKRCTAQEVTLHFIELARQGELDKECLDMQACGDVHFCDVPSDTSFDEAKCAPGRVVVGLPKTPKQGEPLQTGCELTESNPAYQYTDLRGPLSFGKDGKLYAVAGRDCPGLNIEQTDIVAVDPVSKKREVVWGNPGKNFSDALCYNEAAREIDVTNCVVRVNSAVLSPGNNDLVFLATNPNVTDPGLTKETMDIWRVRRDGKEHDWIGAHSEFVTVRSFQVHAAQ